MPVKKHSPAWPAAPEAAAPREERSNSTLLSVLAVIVTLAAVVGIFLVINPPGKRGSEPSTLPSASLSTSAQPAHVETPIIATSATPGTTPSASVSGVASGTLGTPSSSTPANIVPVLSSAADDRKIPDSVAQAPGAGQQAVSASSLVAAAPTSAPVTAPAQVAFAPSAPSARLAAGTVVASTSERSIRNLEAVIDGRPYECFGQLAHLACDLKQ
jgi:hypothetical protein